MGMYRVFQKEIYYSTCIPNVTVWRVLRKHLNLKAYKLSVVQHLFETPCITSGSHLEPQLSHAKLSVLCYIMTV
jgi:hypothetical protein